MKIRMQGRVTAVNLRGKESNTGIVSLANRISDGCVLQSVQPEKKPQYIKSASKGDAKIGSFLYEEIECNRRINIPVLQ